ncbi:DNA-processing protein DprA [Coxiella-like endosymbiont]|uniref:DNA-processing protein DprA n=1 Tax=Coxiella-like endosymbiont TaxID=1592897 RepID=UPI00272BCAF4|nr:DNA-processing protein DprA [Coxiella-like endosymbiont]
MAFEPNHYILTPNQANYLLLLKQISNFPPILYIIDNPHILNDPQVAIVGSRNPTPTKAGITDQLSQKKGFSFISRKFCTRN